MPSSNLPHPEVRSAAEPRRTQDLSCNERLPPPAAQLAGRAPTAAIAPIVALAALAEIAAVALLADQFDQPLAAELARQLPGRPLVAPHQRGMDDEAVVHAERQGRLQRLERVVAAIGVARIVGLAH